MLAHEVSCKIKTPQGRVMRSHDCPTQPRADSPYQDTKGVYVHCWPDLLVAEKDLRSDLQQAGWHAVAEHHRLPG